MESSGYIYARPIIQVEYRRSNKDEEKTSEKNKLDLLRSILLLLARLVGEQLGVDEGHDTTLGDDNVAEELVQSVMKDEMLSVYERRMTHSSSLRMASCK